MKTFFKNSFLLFAVMIFVTSGCDIFLGEDVDLCEKYKRPAAIDQAWRVKMDVERTPYPETYHILLHADMFEAYVTVREMNCERVESDFRQINFTVHPYELVPPGSNQYTFDIGPVEEFTTTNESDYLSVQYYLYAAFDYDGKIYISDTLWFDYSSWTTAVPGDTFNVWISVPTTWYEFRK